MNPKDARPLIITRVREQSREIRSFDLMPETARDKHGVEFRPGQVAVLRIDDDEPAYFAFAKKRVALTDKDTILLADFTNSTGESVFDGTLKQALADPERQIILDMLKKNDWNRSLTAAALGINRTTLYKKMKRLGLEGVLQHHGDR